MAEKSVFISKVEYPFFEEVHVSIDWFGGFALEPEKKMSNWFTPEFLNGISKGEGPGDFIFESGVAGS